MDSERNIGEKIPRVNIITRSPVVANTASESAAVVMWFYLQRIILFVCT
jgi:hypothetical protein